MNIQCFLSLALTYRQVYKRLLTYVKCLVQYRLYSDDHDDDGKGEAINVKFVIKLLKFNITLYVFFAL